MTGSHARKPAQPAQAQLGQAQAAWARWLRLPGGKRARKGLGSLEILVTHGALHLMSWHAGLDESRRCLEFIEFHAFS